MCFPFHTTQNMATSHVVLSYGVLSDARLCLHYWDGCWVGWNSFPPISWWLHQMETFSALLTLCARNSPVNREFPSQRPVTWSFDVFFHLCLNKRLIKQSWGWWFETPSRSLWRRYNDCSAYDVCPREYHNGLQVVSCFRHATPSHYHPDAGSFTDAEHRKHLSGISCRGCV